MSDNVIPFDLISEQQIAALQLGLPRIVLEGQVDVRLFKQFWFTDYIDRFEFVEAADLVDGGGCTAVAGAVARSQSEGVPAFGFSDRDRLFKERQWDLLFSTDDDAFSAATANDDYCTNLRWEVEAYLLEPDLIPSWVRSLHRNPPANTEECDSAVARTIDECERLLDAQRWFGTAHVHGHAVADGHFCTHVPEDFSESCQQELDALGDQGGTAAEIAGYVGAVLGAAPPELPAKLRWLLKYVDTKRLLLRLEHRLSADGRKVLWFLAELMLITNRRPRELEVRLQEAERRLHS